MREEKEDMIRKMKVYRARCEGREGRYEKEDEDLSIGAECGRIAGMP